MVLKAKPNINTDYLDINERYFQNKKKFQYPKHIYSSVPAMNYMDICIRTVRSLTVRIFKDSIYLSERKTESESTCEQGEGKRERERENPK